MLLTYRQRVKDRSSRKWLDARSVSVNFVWNYCGSIQNDSRRLNRRWPSYIDLAKLTAGSAKELGLHSDVVQDVCKHWARSRDKARRKPRWRISRGPKRSLGWIPFQCARPIKVRGDAATFLGRTFRLWLSRPIPNDIRSGSFSQDATGRWYLNLICEVGDNRPSGDGEIGIDLGLKSLASLSDGSTILNPKHVRRSEHALAQAQRAGRKALARKIHRKVAAQRRNFLHEQSARLARENALIVVGNVSSSGLARTRMAKSVLDAGWTMLRSQLRYKAIRHGAVFVETDESYSTQTCSACGLRGGPKGLKGLRVREWVCDSCGVLHNRDTNAAINILLSGRNAALQLTESSSIRGQEGVTGHVRKGRAGRREPSSS